MKRRLMLLLLVVVTVVVRVLGQVVDSGMDEQMRADILTRHNLIRSRTRASNMLELRWSENLEREAAKWVDQCVFAHQVDPPWGENIFRSNFNKSSSSIVHSGLSAWDLESYLVREDKPCCEPSTNVTLCCSYSQMVWATTRDVGCALKQCAKLYSTEVDDDTWFMACYYSPAGNAPSATATPYMTSPNGPCADCPFSYQECKSFLCTPSTWCKGNP